MGKYISFGKFNKYYFFILGSITVRFIIIFITGFTPYLSPNDTVYIFGFKSFKIFSHPLLTNCFQYFATGLGGLILENIFNKNEEEKVFILNEPLNINDDQRKCSKESLMLYNISKENNKIYFKTIVIIYFFYYFAKSAMSSLDNLGFNRVKFWPIEFIFLYFFMKKILGKNIYFHQLVSLTIIILFCTTIYLVNSFIPYTNEKCSKIIDDNKHSECILLSANIYKDISNKLEWYFIPIIILTYMAAMVCNAYSSIKNKWFMDFKYITMYKILYYLGIVGLLASILLLIIFTYLPCPDDENKIGFINYICEIKYKDSFFYDNFKELKEIKLDKNVYLEIFLILPIFLVSSFLNAFFELLIINKLDPFYLVPIDCAYFLIYEIIDYYITFHKTNFYRNIKFIFQVTSNTVSVLVCCIYLEIFELHFCELDKEIRTKIIEREHKDSKSMELLNDKVKYEDKNDEDEEDINYVGDTIIKKDNFYSLEDK